MNREYIKQQIEETNEQMRRGKENARRIEARLIEISDYLDKFLGPVSEESIRAFEEKYGRSCQKETAEQKHSDKK